MTKSSEYEVVIQPCHFPKEDPSPLPPVTPIPSCTAMFTKAAAKASLQKALLLTLEMPDQAGQGGVMATCVAFLWTDA